MHLVGCFPSHTCRACVLPVCATQNATNQPHRKENENNHLKEVTKLRFRMLSGSIWFNLLLLQYVYCSVWSKFTHEMLSFRVGCGSQFILGLMWVSQCLSVCNSSPCSEQSLPRSGLPQEQCPQHARSLLENRYSHIAKFQCSLVFKSASFYLVSIGPRTLFSQQLLWACNVHWLLSIAVLVTFCRYLQSRGNFLTA